MRKVVSQEDCQTLTSLIIYFFSLKQESGSGLDSTSNMVMGLTYYELWYSYIPKELKWRDSDLPDSPATLDLVGSKFSNQVGHSEWHNTVESHIGENPYKCDSDTSVVKDKKRSMDVDQHLGVSMEVDVNNQRGKIFPDFQPQGFYLDSEEHTGNGDSHMHHRIHMPDDASLYALGNFSIDISLSFSHTFSLFCF